MTTINYLKANPVCRLTMFLILSMLFSTSMEGQTILRKTLQLTDENIEKKDPYSIRLLSGFNIKANSEKTNTYFRASIGDREYIEREIPVIDPTYNLVSNENYTYKRVYLEETQTSNASKKQTQSITYYDGLGRPKQAISIKSTPLGKDIVTYIPYDSYGRQVENWLPAPLVSKRGSIQENAKDEIINYYKQEFRTSSGVPETRPYSSKIISESPLNKLKEVQGIGEEWSNNPSKIDYDINNNTDIFQFIAKTIYSTGVSNSVLTGNKYYSTGELWKYINKDEDQNEVVFFKNNLGQTLLTRKNDGTSILDTYYVYNVFNQLVYIIPPKAVNTLKANPGDQSVLNSLCYQYQYDDKNRLIAKKTPDKGNPLQNDGWEYFIYDNQERLIATQDPILRKTNEWLFTKYDKFDRIAYTGLKNGGNRLTEQSLADNSGNNNTIRDNQNGFSQNNLIIYYKNDGSGSYPSSINKLLTINYYDTYPPESPSFSTIFGAIQLSSDLTNQRNTNGLLLASYTNTIDTNEWTKNYSWYDNEGHDIITETKSPLGGRTRSERKLRFSGVPEEIITWHNRNGASDILIKERFEYDHQERLIKQYHKVNTYPEELLTEYRYGELGNITNKIVGGNLQNIAYKYNIRGQITHINDPQNISDKLFAMQIKYNNPVAVSNAKAKFNGNISQIDWASQHTDGILKRYTFDYDGVNRLKSAKFWDEINTDRNSFSETLTYDLNGNIATLKRFGDWQGSFAENMDDLKYHYDGNKLKNIEEVGLGNLQSGYHLPPYTMGKNIEYDINGNMTKHEDNNITNIQYNFLDLPQQIVSKGSIINFAYLADGTKTKKSVEDNITEYLNGFNYENGVLQFFPTEEGYYDAINNRYVYNYNDLNNNIRISYYKGNQQQAVILSDKDYYPFGLEHSTGLKNNPNYQYTYQGQEKQIETGWLSFKWRNYDPAMGRFFNIDPLSEKYGYQSHYNFSENRVIDGVELEGLEFASLNEARAWAMENGWGIDIVDEQFVLTTPEKEINGVTITATKSSENAKGNSINIDFDNIQGSNAPSLSASESTIGDNIQEFRNAPAPNFTGIAGTVIKGFVDSALDAANLVRNVAFNQKNYSGLVPRMTGWNGWPLGGQEGLDQSVNGITFLGGLMTGGMSEVVEQTSLASLNPTHAITKSKSQMQILVNDIGANGVKNPIKYVEFNGQKYIVDGHHRFYSAQKAGLESIPVEKVKLPYGGYKTNQDLMMEGKQPGYWKYMKVK